MAKNKERVPANLPLQKKIDAGCYIDFEGFAGNEYQKFPPPVLIGVLRGNEFQQVVFTKKYRWAAQAPDVANPVVFEPDRAAYLKKLVAEASGSKPIFAYSEYERNVIKFHIGHDFPRRYRNVRAIAARWFNKNPQSGLKPTSNELHEVALTLGLSMPEKLPRGGITDRLRLVSEYSSSEKKWSMAPPDLRKAWREILVHRVLTQAPSLASV